MPLNTLLRLPDFRYTGDINLVDFVYEPNEAEDWDGKLLLASRREEYPLAWVPHQVADYYEMDEASFLADTDFTKVAPTIPFATAGSLIRAPRACLINGILTLNNAGFPFGDLFDPLSAALAAKHVWCGRGVDYHSSSDGAFHMTLPHTSVPTTSDTDDTTTYEFEVPTPTYAEWKGGECLFISLCNLLSSVYGPFISVEAGPETVYVRENHRQAWIDVLQAAYPRYERFRYHVVYALNASETSDVTSGDPNWPSREPAFRAAVQDAVDELEDYGVTLTILDDFVAADIKADIQAVVADFFDL